MCSKPGYLLQDDFFNSKPKLDLVKIPANHDKTVKSYSVIPKNFYQVITSLQGEIELTL